MPAPATFAGPKLVHDVDVERYIRACPADATTQGTFFRYLCDALEKTHGGDERLYTGLSRRDWTIFRKYPLRDFMTLVVNAARIAFPGEAMSEGLRRMGRLAYPSFAATM